MPFVGSPPAAAPRRIVSLCPSTTETLHWLGAWDRVVGRTRYCVHPRGLVQAVPHVRGTKNPDLDALIALRPDLVLAVKEENRLEDVEALDALGVPVLLLDPNDVVAAAAAMRELGDAIDCPIEGELLARRILAQRDAVLARRSAARPRIACLIWWEPAMAVGSGTFMGALLDDAGFLNACGGEARYPEVGVEALAGLQLDAVLLPSEPYAFSEGHRTTLAAAAGLPIERVLLVDGELLSWHGARTVRGLAYAADLAASVVPRSGSLC